jgi:GTP diphosphokinase / guanosine-3',5'-bis(diphosphate) 3'-diphosphatase
LNTKTNYRDLLKVCAPIDNKNVRPVLHQGYRLLCSEYDKQYSVTGGPLLDHAIKLTGIVVNELNLGYTSAISALFSFASVRSENVLSFLHENNLSDSIPIIESFQKISELPSDRLIKNAENYTGIILAMATDVRAILLSLAENLYLLRNISSLESSKSTDTLNKSVSIYIPLAHKLGLYRIKAELEEIAFKVSQPEKYKQLAGEIALELNRNKDFIQKFIEPIELELKRMDLVLP